MSSWFRTALLRCAGCGAFCGAEYFCWSEVWIVLSDGAGWVEERGRFEKGFVCARSYPSIGCLPLYEEPLVCSDACEERVLADPSWSVLPEEVRKRWTKLEKKQTKAPRPPPRPASRCANKTKQNP
jgi:hypothetical protein